MCVCTSYNETMESTRGQAGETPYHVWFHIECIVEPAPPDHTITMSTPTLSTSTLPLTITNPSAEKLSLEVHPIVLYHMHYMHEFVHAQVLVEGHGLTGPSLLEIEPSGESSYPLTFSPTLYGTTDGRLAHHIHSNHELLILYIELCLMEALRVSSGID